MAKLLSCVLGPRLYKIYRERDSERAPSGVPETPTSVTAPPSSSWVSRVLPWSKTWYGPNPFAAFAPQKRPLLEMGEPGCQASCLQSGLCASWVKVTPADGLPLYRFLPSLSHSDCHSLLFPLAAPHPVFRGSCWSQLTLSPGRDPARIRELDDFA